MSHARTCKNMSITQIDAEPNFFSGRENMTRPALLDQGERTDEGRGSLPSPSLLHLPAPPPIFRLKISPKKDGEKVF